ncbi:uncharacterized protein [Macrobrachium rosenbergii]|uniref:uncharacterized protein n=1 Tax=Macrobrachium rosenbergii TaxID=79674 RepID=UPI0034D4AAF3
MESSHLECKICCNEFSEDRCPRILPCSHSFCGPCIDELISTQKKHCPVCREEFTVDSAEDLMINRDLLDVAKLLSSMHLGSKTSASAPRKSILEFTEDFRENVIGKGIAVCKEMEADVKACIESNNEMRKGLEGFIQTLEEIKFYTENTLTNIDQNNKELMNRLDIMQLEHQNMKESERKLEKATDYASAGATMDGVGKVLHGVEKTISEIKQLLQENDRRRDDMRQDTLRIKRNFTDAIKGLGRIIEELGNSVVNITVTDLRSPHGCLRGEAQRAIFAVMTFKGKLRVAPVKIESNNQLYVNHLQEGVLPPRCFVIELESLMQGCPSPSPSPPPRAFLDLAYESTHLGRIIIRVTGNGIWGLNFLYMCAGGMGPSYANSQFLDAYNKGGPGEWIRMGDCVSHGGGSTSTQAVLSSREDWERESKREEIYEETPYKAGDVRGFISYEGASLFWIVTRDRPSWKQRYCFGMVEEGLDVLRDAISKYPDITQVKVAECGLVFSL